MSTINLYETILVNSSGELTEELNHLATLGFAPIGNLTVDNEWYTQLMVHVKQLAEWTESHV